MKTQAYRPFVWAAWSGSLALLCAPLSAQERPDEEVVVEEDPDDHPHNLLGAKMTALTTIFAEEATTGFGASGFYERALIQGALELELSAAFLDLGEHSVVPLDVILKVPFSCNHHVWEPYLGGGAALDWVLKEGGNHLYPGGLLVAGSYVWLTRDFGLDAELVYSVVFEAHTLHELIPSLGVVTNF